MARIDPHSAFDTTQPQVQHVRVRWQVDFQTRQLTGEAHLVFAQPASGPVDLDTKGLTLLSVQTQDGQAVPYRLGPDDPVLGQTLRLDLPAQTSAVTIAYHTSPQAIALQWLEPAQTEGKQQPFLYSQCQAIHARSILPVQDTPRVRITYEAEVTVPEPLTAVMSAGPRGAQRSAAGRTFSFAMPQPIPPYLMALAVGDLASCDLSPRARIWAEPGVVQAAAEEFAEVEAMIGCAESLFGPYVWERYDMLVLPPAFPYGGMENPRMTFLTPTVLAGDRSLVDVVAHELAHSWTGNLVTNASMEHFWLNEGFTTWAERRILTALHGEEAGVLSWAIGQHALDASLARFGSDSPFTRLQMPLQDVDPDEAFSSVPYEKGARFVVALERAVGRSRFDTFLRAYMQRFQFQSITSEEFVQFLEEQLPGTAERVQAQEWLYTPGIPAHAPVFTSAKLEALTALAQGWSTGTRPTPAHMQQWTPQELLVFLQHLPRQLDHEALAWLDTHLHLTSRGNYEILVEWLSIAGASDYAPVFARLREVLLRVGRMKFLRPLFVALGQHARTQQLGREIYEAAQATY
ncbi:MAG: M1 family metallopeptidase, partial [Candidatus Tectomicrobia bacterium]|nr:M1 family metallopeptidase [Candidatus Tectomicrobia bacterium]